MILLSDNMFDYIVRLLGWAVEGGTKVSKHPVLAELLILIIGKSKTFTYLGQFFLYFPDPVSPELSSFDSLLHGSIGLCFSVVEGGHRGYFLGLGLGEEVGTECLAEGDTRRGSGGQSPLCSHPVNKQVDDLLGSCSDVHSI